MGKNDVGTTFLGPDRMVSTNNLDVMNAMGEYGSGIVIAGGHGSPSGTFLPNPEFASDTAAFFNNASNAYFGPASVVDMNQLSSLGITTLGGPGVYAYVN
jgi:hypothetical protein